MRKYASIQNRVLVDYKKFRDSIVQQLKMMKEIKDLPQNSNPTIEEKRLKLKAIKDKHNMKLNETLNNFIKKRTQEHDSSITPKPLVPDDELHKERNAKSATRLQNLLVRPTSQDKQIYFLKERSETRNQLMNKTFTSIGGKSTMNLERGRQDSQTHLQTVSPDNLGLKSQRNINDFTTLDQYIRSMKTEQFNDG